MTYPRGRIVFASAALITAGIVFACGFPSVTFGGAEGSLPDAEETPLPTDVDPEGKNQEAATRDGSSTRVDAGPDATGCAAVGLDPCDCDGDKSKNGSPGCAPPGDDRADCDDFDPLVNPDQDFVAAPWDPASPHLPANDWNCNGKVTKQYLYNIDCATLGANCAEGFVSDVPCGAKGPYNICKVGLNILGIQTCSVDRTEVRTQGCR